ncbi:MAG: hypothetical protein WD004_05580 [Actinomycetota bacterium]
MVAQAAGQSRRGTNRRVLAGVVAAVLIASAVAWFAVLQPRREAEARAETCAAELSPALEELETIDSKLNVGLTQADFGSAVADANVAMDRVDAPSLPGECAGIFQGPMIDAIELYTSTNTEWNDCITTTACDTDRLNMQPDWTEASIAIATAHEQLDAVEQLDVAVAMEGSLAPSADSAADSDMMQDRLRNSIAAAKIYWTEGGTYSGLDAAQASALEPSNHWADGSAPTPGQVSIVVASGNTIQLVAGSDEGMFLCYYEDLDTQGYNASMDFADVDGIGECGNPVPWL